MQYKSQEKKPKWKLSGVCFYDDSLRGRLYGCYTGSQVYCMFAVNWNFSPLCDKSYLWEQLSKVPTTNYKLTLRC